MSLFLSSSIIYDSWAVQIQLSCNFHVTLSVHLRLSPLPKDSSPTYSLVTLTLVAFYLLLLHHQDRSCYLVSSHPLSGNCHLHIWPPLPGCFLTFLSSQTPGQFLLLAVPAHSEAGQQTQLCSSSSKSTTFEPSSFGTAPLFESEDSKTIKAPQLFILPQISIFSISLCKILITVKEIWSSRFIFHALLPDVR